MFYLYALHICTDCVHHMARTAQLNIMHTYFGCLLITSVGADQSTKTFTLHVDSDNSNKAFHVIDANMLAIFLLCLTQTVCALTILT